jgi:rhodanese-related sulfurtransferase
MSAPRISKEDLKLRMDGEDSGHPGPVIIDVRLKYPYEHSTVMLPGAIRMAPEALAAATLPRDRDLVLYDSDPEELVSARAAALLSRQGYRAYALQGGIADWVSAKLPTDSKPAPQLSTTPAGGSANG